MARRSSGVAWDLCLVWEWGEALRWAAVAGPPPLLEPGRTGRHGSVSSEQCVVESRMQRGLPCEAQPSFCGGRAFVLGGVVMLKRRTLHTNTRNSNGWKYIYERVRSSARRKQSKIMRKLKAEGKPTSQCKRHDIRRGDMHLLLFFFLNYTQSALVAHVHCIYIYIYVNVSMHICTRHAIF
jgi:hypothetical protein